MTIEERINRAKDEYETGLASIELNDKYFYFFNESELQDLLEQVAKEQRELCAEQVHLPVDVEQGDEMSIMCDVQNAPSPLKKG